DLFGVAFVALVPFLVTLAGAGRGAALVSGYACGGAFFFALLYWIPRVLVVYGGLSRPAAGLLLALLVFYLASYVAVFAWLLAATWRRFGPVAVLGAPVFWVGLEIARARLLSGFPWGLLGYSQYRDLPILQAATLGGIYAVSLLVMAANCGVALCVLASAPRRARVAGGALLLAVALAGCGGLLALRGAQGSRGGPAPFRVAAIQGNVSEVSKWSPGAEARILADLVRLTQEAAARGAVLVVWPESASPYSLRVPVREEVGESGQGAGRVTLKPAQEYVDLVSGLARDLRIGLIVGSVDYEVRGGDLSALNSAFAVGPDGSLGPSYDKIHLVPFGEYVPLQRLLFFVNRMVRGAIAGFAPGTRLVLLPTPAGPAATLICYEAIFPELVRALARRGATILVNITNDAWFGQTAAPRQHLAMAVVRAVENRRFLLRSANTGISAVVDPFGRIVEETSLETQTVLVGSVVPGGESTPYARAGDLLAWSCAILTLLHAAALRAAAAHPMAGTGARVR
ncbi:MAG TPA: apolipoprotein N-acyltransferase, partial [Candidatus Polarisedimenticolia bacterium]|nr:apolipoprotein N-acyltransferase [Candidatus Polarisedimenticolia bacterium]